MVKEIIRDIKVENTENNRNYNLPLSISTDKIQSYSYITRSFILFRFKGDFNIYKIKEPNMIVKFLSIMNGRTIYGNHISCYIKDKLWHCDINKEWVESYSEKEELYLEIILDNNERYFVSDVGSIHQFLSDYTVSYKDFKTIKNELEDLQTKVNELEEAIKYIPLGQEYDKAKKNYESLSL